MNYYERHLGDYARDTGHLSIIEHGIYTLLLDRYYITEQGIPEEQAYRLSRARTDVEREAVDLVLSEFFELIDGIWVNHRAEEEISKFQEKQRKASASANARWSKTKSQCEGNADASKTQCEGNAHQTPITNHQTKTLSDNKTHTENLEIIGDELTAGSVCSLLRELGIVHTNPGHEDLSEALRGGAVRSDFEFAAVEAANKNVSKPFPYLLKIVLKRIEDRSNAKPSTTKTKQHQVDPGFAEKYAEIFDQAAQR